eukprot:3760495-Amphidinium_carterae.1
MPHVLRLGSNHEAHAPPQRANRWNRTELLLPTHEFQTLCAKVPSHGGVCVAKGEGHHCLHEKKGQLLDTLQLWTVPMKGCGSPEWPPHQIVD